MGHEFETVDELHVDATPDQVWQAIATGPGIVYFENDDTVGIRAGDAIYRFLRGFHGPVMACHHLFYEAHEPEQAWLAWLTTEDLT